MDWIGLDWHVIISFITGAWMLFLGINWNMICNFVSCQPISKWFGSSKCQWCQKQIWSLAGNVCKMNSWHVLASLPYSMYNFIYMLAMQNCPKTVTESLVPSKNSTAVAAAGAESQKVSGFRPICKISGICKALKSSQILLLTPCETFFENTWKQILNKMNMSSLW